MSFRISWGECINGGSSTLDWPTAMSVGIIILIMLIDVGRLSLKVDSTMLCSGALDHVRLGKGSCAWSMHACVPLCT